MTKKTSITSSNTHTKEVAKRAAVHRVKAMEPSQLSEELSNTVNKPKVAVAEASNVNQKNATAYDNHESYMGASMKKHFRKLLLDYKQQLMEKVDNTVHHMKDDSANLPDLNDRATLEEEFNLELRTRDRERKLIKKVEQSLQAIEEDNYGYCESCGAEIGMQRLQARPTATLCIDCKTIEELKEKQRD